MKGILFGYNPYSRNLLGINMKDIISLEVQYEEIPGERDGDGVQEVFYGYLINVLFEDKGKGFSDGEERLVGSSKKLFDTREEAERWLFLQLKTIGVRTNALVI